ncbi:MAG: DUF2974 domain-containing protein [Treponema sp.]|jgi:hypothetical protein|nr:DUF2974 domain-containing protein [Treponema sp.]
MAQLLDYLLWRGDLSFAQSPFNPVDNIILCQLSYLPFDGIVPGPDENSGISVTQALSALSKKLENKKAKNKPVLMYKGDPELVKKLGLTNRFGGCNLFGFVNHIDTERELQFSALCVETGDGSCSIVYRGTDFSLVGWKEDFNMSFSEVIPAQIEAEKYLEKAAEKIRGHLRIAGHSKGGNLAVYAASQCGAKIQKRITAIYSNDAPGFHENVIGSKGFAAVKDRIQSFVPQASVVGMLLEHGNDYTVVKSSAAGLLQHDLYTWEVTHDNLVNVDQVTPGSRFVDKTVRDWINSLDKEHREKFFDSLFDILNSSQAKSIPELERSWFTAASRMIYTLGNIDSSTRSLLRKTIRALIRSAGKNITLLKPEKGNGKK